MAKDSAAEVGGRVVEVGAETVKGVGKIVRSFLSGRRQTKSAGSSRKSGGSSGTRRQQGGSSAYRAGLTNIKGAAKGNGGSGVGAGGGAGG
jgi:hypothetical protein